MKMKKLILFLMMGILVISLAGANEFYGIKKPGFPSELNNNLCGFIKDDKLISFNQNPDCFCPKKLEKIVVWIQPYCPPGKFCIQYFFPAYTCKK